MAPIDREDGRHWCDPASETPDTDGRWECPCGHGWRLDWDGVWRSKGEALPKHPEVDEVIAAATDGTAAAEANQQEVGDYPTGDVTTEEQG